MHRAAKRVPRFAVIMAGGHGTRFWPLARRSHPKQFLPLRGERSFLQETVRRILPSFGWDRILVVTAEEHAVEVAAQLPELSPDHVLVEPEGRNTAACLTLACEWIDEHVGDAVIAALPADHAIDDARALRQTLRRAEEIAWRHPALVVVGIPPTRPEVGFGYIESGAPVEDGDDDARWVRRFHEKPDARTAKRYVRSGRHLWNAGMFVWRATTFRVAMEQCAPAILRALNGVFDGSGDTAARIAKAYARLPAVPIDVSLLQNITSVAAPSARVAVVPARFSWLDAGSWEAMAELWGTDARGNALRGDAIAIDSSGCIAYAGERMIVLVGATDLVVVDAGDAVLVCPRTAAQDVRSVQAELKRRRLDRFL